MVKRFDVYLVDLIPTRGSEIFKTRPALIISPDEMNKYLKTVIIAPVTTKGRKFPTRVGCHFAGKDGQIALDQIISVDKSCLMKKMGEIDNVFGQQSLEVLISCLKKNSLKKRSFFETMHLAKRCHCKLLSSWTYLI